MKILITYTLLLTCLSSFSQVAVQINNHSYVHTCDDSVILSAPDSIIIQKVYFTEPVESLVSNDHTSEGFILGLENGDLINIFRLDPGYNGNHVGNNAKLVKRISSDYGLSWTNPEVIFDDVMYDDRNMQGGLIGRDSIIVFFRKFNAPFWQQIGLFYFYSFDGGNSWTEPIPLATNLTACAFGTSKIIHVPNRGFLMPIYQQFYVELRFSEDGFSWDSIAYKWDYRSNFLYRISEVSFAYTGNGQIVGIMRNDRVGFGQNYYMVFSSDFGFSWTEPQTTNLAHPFTCPAPLVFYDDDHNDLWTIVSDRRSNIPGMMAYEESLWIYRNHVHDIAETPHNFTLTQQIQRPLSSDFRLYGYPAQMKLGANRYLIIFTESYRKPNGFEGAYLYQFEIIYDSVKIAIENFAWSNGSQEYETIIFESGEYSVTITDELGNEYIHSIILDIDPHPYYVFGSDTIYGANGYAILNAENEGKTFEWSTGENSQIITVYEQGWYYVTITNSCDLTITDSVYVYIDITQKPISVALSELNIYPNPAAHELFIDIPENEEMKDAIIKIYNMTGDLLYLHESDSHFIDIEWLTPATYLLEIHINENIYRERFIKI